MERWTDMRKLKLFSCNFAITPQNEHYSHLLPISTESVHMFVSETKEPFFDRQL